MRNAPLLLAVLLRGKRWITPKNQSVGRGFLGMVDHQNLDWPPGGLRLQPGLVLQRLKDRRRGVLCGVACRGSRVYRATDRLIAYWPVIPVRSITWRPR
jgi:hypothetical protein